MRKVISEFEEEYKKWFEKWEGVLKLNQKGDYSKGYATYNAGGDIVLIFD